MEKLKTKNLYKVDQSIFDKMKSVYLNCPTAINYVKNLGIPEELIDRNIDAIYDLARDINYCNKCPGIENCIKENPLLCTRIVYQDGFVERQLTPCRRLLEKMQIKNQFIVMDFPEKWLNSTFDSLNKNDKRKDVIKKYIAYSKGKSSEWIYLCGEQKTGRSYLAATIAVDVARKEKGPVAFVNVAQRFRQLSDLNYKNNELFQKILSQYCNVPVLVLDDFGNEYKNDFIRDAILFEIISNRASKNLFTIFTSDFDIDTFVTLYSTTKASTVRAKQIGKLLKNQCVKESNLGEISIY